MRGKQRVVASGVLSLVVSLAALAQPAPPPAAPGRTRIQVRPGTKLAGLIQETTPHVAALAPTNPRFRLDVPDWLRAHYRRHHVEMLTAARVTDPTGGLPLALENLYIWMLHHQDFQPTPAPAATPPRMRAAVGKNTRISGDGSSPKSESDIRGRVENATQIIGASNRPADGNQAQFYSKDGGATWGQASLPLLSGDSLQSDPTVDWTSDGTAWATTIGISADTTVLQMRAYKSSDGGQTWQFDGTFSGEQTSADKQMTWIDHGATSPFRDNIYVIWHDNAPAFVNRRTAAGWQVPLRVSGAETTGTAIGADITANSSGDVFAVWPDTGSQNLFVIKSVDGGATFSAPAALAKTFGSFQVRVPAFAERGALIGVSIAAFRDTTRNDVYVSFVDLSGEAGCNVPENEPLNDTSSPCKSRVWFTRSTDGGATWSPPQKINDTASANDQFNQRLAVDPASGTLGIVYYDTAADSGRKKTNLVFQASVDNGAHWSSPATTVSSAMSDETTGNADQGNQYGDYNGLTVAGGVFFPSWTDRRTNTAEAIFTAPITVTKDPSGNAVPALAPARPASGARPGPPARPRSKM